MSEYEYRHVVSFEETNLAGNACYASHIRWQGRCREMFLRDHAPDMLPKLSEGLRLVTTRCSCAYLGELSALDEVIVRMRLDSFTQNRITMLFDYWRKADGEEELVARGEQELTCMNKEGSRLAPVPIPKSLREALQAYAAEECTPAESAISRPSSLTRLSLL